MQYLPSTETINYAWARRMGVSIPEFRAQQRTADRSAIPLSAIKGHVAPHESAEECCIMAVRQELLGIAWDAVEHGGWSPLKTQTAAELFIKLHTAHPSLILLDTGWNDCWKVVDEFASGRYQRHPPVQLLARTPLSNAEIERAVQIGAIGCLTGPFELKLLQVELEQIRATALLKGAELAPAGRFRNATSYRKKSGNTVTNLYWNISGRKRRNV